MRALSNVSLPRTAQSQDFHRSQAERANESRLNQNFHLLQGSIAEMEIIEDSLDKRIQKLENPAFSPAIESVSDSTNWRVVKYNTGDTFLYEKTPNIVMTPSTAEGALYTAFSNIDYPFTFSSVDNIQITGFGDVIPVVMATSNSGFSFKIFATDNTPKTFSLFISVHGKV